MNKKYSYLIKNTGILAISNFSSKILIFLLVPLYTSVLSTTEYGLYDLVYTTIQLLFPILTLNIVEAVMRFFLAKEGEPENVLRIGLKFVLISILIEAILVACNYALGVFPSLKPYSILIFLFFLTYTLNQFYIQYAKGIEKIRVMGLAGVIGTICMVATNVIFLLVIKLGLTGFFLASICGQGIPVLYYCLVLRPWKCIKIFHIDNGSQKKLQNSMLLYALPLIPTSVAWWVNSASDRYIITLLIGVSANGILSVAYKIPNVMSTLQQIFIQAWHVSAIKEYNEEESVKFYQKTFSYCMSLMCICASLLILLSKFLAGFLYAKDFYVAWQYVPFLIISSLMNCAAGFIGPILTANKNNIPMLRSAVAGAVCNVILNFLFGYLFGIQGVCIATTISSYVIYEVRNYALKGMLSKAEGYKWVVISWLILILQAVIIIYTKLFLLNLVLFLLIVIIYRKEIRLLFIKLPRTIK